MPSTYASVFIPEREIVSLLDMLRYDAAIVVDWRRETDDRDRAGYRVFMRTERPITIDRWRSFGLYPVVGG